MIDQTFEMDSYSYSHLLCKQPCCISHSTVQIYAWSCANTVLYPDRKHPLDTHVSGHGYGIIVMKCIEQNR